MKIYKILIGLLGMLLLAESPASAQKSVHDEQKEKQWKSMENGPWDFSPDWYYYFLHKDYSGAEKYWKWKGFKSGYHIRFKENKSDVKRIMPTRMTSEETQNQKMKKAESERAYIEELYKEEVARTADRNVDLTYSSFKGDFNRMQESISDGLLFCLKKSKGKMKFQVEQLSKENEILCADIAYIHKTGVGYELENTKREKAYLKMKKRMETLVSRTAHLVGMAQVYY
jgi:hypothetical protein